MTESANRSTMADSEFVQYFELLKQDLFRLRSQWRTYKALFGTNSERYSLLFGISGIAASTIERTLFEATLLGIRRLTDDPEKGRRKRRNVSIKGVKKHLGDGNVAVILQLVKNASTKSDFARNWSDKKIAHSDYEYRLGALPLSPASRKAVDEAIDSISDVIKWVSSEKFNTTLVTDPIAPADDDVRLLEHLYEGRAAFEKKEELSREFSHEGRYEERDQLYRFPAWLQREEPILDI